MRKLLVIAALGLVVGGSAPAGAQAASFEPTIRVTTPVPGNTIRVRYRITCDGVVDRGWYRDRSPSVHHPKLPVASPRSCRLKAWAWNLTGPSAPEVDVSL